jgi:hypothetical protein
LSDHISILFEVNVEKSSELRYLPTYGRLRCRNFRKADWEGLSHFYRSLDWNSIFLGKVTVDHKWDAFKEIFQSAVSQFVPFLKGKRKFEWSKKTHNLFRITSRLHRKFKIFPSAASKSAYKIAAYCYRKSRRKEVQIRNQRIYKSINSRNFWTFVRGSLKATPQLPCLIDETGSVIVADAGKAQLLQHQFTSVFTSDNGVRVPIKYRLPDADSIENIFITPESVKFSLSLLKPKVSYGSDGIPSIFLRKLADVLALPLCFIYNCSLDTSTLPLDWRTGVITPLPKNGKSSKPNQYRPISLVSNVCKGLERQIHSAILFHCRSHNVLSPFQHGFMPKRSVSSQLLCALDDWSNSLDNNIPIDVLYIDIAKAFDTVSHPKLLDKLHACGIRGSLFSWIKAYLSNRVQVVRINCSASLPSDVLSGVPQGSILGPLFFALFINDIADVIKNSNILMYADDCKLYRAVRNPHDHALFKEDIAQVFEWAQYNQLSIAFQKCKILHLSSRFNHRYSYSFGDTPIDEVDIMKDLGVFVDRDLTFNTHIAKLVEKCSIMSNMIFRCFGDSPNHVLIHLFKTLIYPLLITASVIWLPHQKGEIALIENVQRRFTRRLDGCGALSYGMRLSMFGLKPIEQVQIEIDLITTYKLCRYLMETPKYNILKRDVRNLNLRSHNFNLLVQRSAKSVRKYYFANRITPIWNSLPSHVVNSTSPAVFKSNLGKLERLICSYLKGGCLD